MVSPEAYWILHGVDSFGHSQSREISEAKAFFLEQFEQPIQGEVIEDKKIQARLFEWYRNKATTEQVNAELCLRCFISHCIYQFCLRTEQQYHENYGLSKNDLFPVVLDSIRHLKLTTSQVDDSLSQEILDTFELEKHSNLSTWTKIKVKGNRNYKKILKLYGIVEVTDWLILVKATLGNLDRKLKQRGYSDYERKEYGELLEAFHQVYTTELLTIREEINRHRVEEGRGKTNKPYPTPTEEQLKKIAQLLDSPKLLEPQEVLNKLKAIAKIIRISKTSPSDNFPSFSPAPKSPEPEHELLIFIQEKIEDNLFTVVRQVIDTRINYFLNQKKTQREKVTKLIESLKLFYCQQYSMGEIASIINFKDRSKVSRLLKLKELREDVCRSTISFLKEQLTEQLSSFICDSEKLAFLDTKIQDFLVTEIKEIMNEAKKEALNSQNRNRNSLFARTVCQCVQQRGQNNYEY